MKIAKMSSAVPPAHHPSECMDIIWMSDCSFHNVRLRLAIWLYSIQKRVSKCHNHTESYTASIRWNADFTLKNRGMTAQTLYSAFPFRRPTNCLLELDFATVKCSTDLTTLDCIISSADLRLELLRTPISFQNSLRKFLEQLSWPITNVTSS